MIKYIVSIALTALLSFVAGLYLPWWSIAVSAFLVGAIIPQKPWMAFLGGFLGVFLLWEILAWGLDSANNSILSQKVAQIFKLGNSTLLIVLISSIIGSLVAGFAALAGSYLHRKT